MRLRNDGGPTGMGSRSCDQKNLVTTFASMVARKCAAMDGNLFSGGRIVGLPIRSLVLSSVVALPALNAVPPAFNAGRSVAPREASSVLVQNIENAYLGHVAEIDSDLAAIVDGNYTGSGKLILPNADMRRNRSEICSQLLASIAKVDRRHLDPMEAARLDMVRNDLESAKFNVDTLRRWECSPYDLDYWFGMPIGMLLERNYAPIGKRLSDVSERLAMAPKFFAAIRGSLGTPTKPALDEAIDLCDSDLAVVGKQVPMVAEGAKMDPAAKATLLERVALAKKAIIAHKEWLLAIKAKLDSNGGYRDYRLGKENFLRVFNFQTQVGIDADVLYRKGLAEFQELKTQMAEAARKVWPKVSGGRPMPTDPDDLISATIKAIGDRHGTAAEILPKCKADVEEARRWVEIHGLLTLPQRQALVRDVPPSMRDGGQDFNAFLMPSGVDPKSPAIYYIEVPNGTPEENEPVLRAATDGALMSISLHEMIPGHFAQIGHEGLSAVQKSVHLPGTQEGWAVYAERMMVETGFKADDPEFLLAYDRDMIAVVSCFLLDYQTHVLGMGKKEAMNLMMKESFQDQVDAEERWERCVLSPGQGSTYYAGVMGLLALRERARREWGKDFSLRKFNDRVLACGPIPIKDMPSIVLPN